MRSVYERKAIEYNNFFTLLYFKLRRFRGTDFISLSDFHLIVDKFKPILKFGVKDMHYTLDRIWKLFDFGESQEVDEIKLRLEEFVVNFNKRHHDIDFEFRECANYIQAHEQKDFEILNIIRVHSLHEKLHNEDENILFDLHEYSKDNPQLNLTLISWDKDFIEVVVKLIDKLSFDKYIGLNDIKNNNQLKNLL